MAYAKLGDICAGNDRWGVERSMFMVTDVDREQALWQVRSGHTNRDRFAKTKDRSSIMIVRPVVDHGEG